MKALYFFDGYLEDSEYSGVKRKVEAQIEEMGKNNVSVDLYTSLKSRSLWEKIIIRLPFTTAIPKTWISCFPLNYDCVYLRYTWSDRGLISFLSKISRHTKRIIIEIPTYPYEGELSKLRQKPILIKDKIFRRELHKYVDRIITFSKEKEIFGIPTINTVNGIKVNNIRKKQVCSDLNEIHIISVASLAKWHGYDRFLNGMAQYYRNGGSRKIVYHCVGDGKILLDYRKIVEVNHLEEHVIFHDRQTGDALDKIYDLCSLGIEILGCHRKGVVLSSTLKSREYWAKGLPFITECEFPPEVQKISQYILKVPYDESPIDIEKVIEFHDNLYLRSDKSQEEIIDEIRDFAYRTCDMSVAMKPIIDYIKSNEH